MTQKQQDRQDRWGAHRIGLPVHDLPRREVRRTISEDGSITVLESHLAGLDLEPVDRVEDHVIHRTRIDGATVYVVTTDDDPEALQQCATQYGGGPTVRRYRPRREYRGRGGEVYATIGDARAACGDEQEIRARYDQVHRLVAQGLAAAQAAGGVVTGTLPVTRVQAQGLTRAGYEAACAAVGLVPAADDDTDLDGVYDPAHYTVEHMVWARLAHLRHDGIRMEAAQGDQAALAAAEQAVPGRASYTRGEYERACAAAGLPPARDDTCRAYWLEHQVGRVPGSAAVTLAGRRVQGVVDRKDTYVASSDTAASSSAVEQLPIPRDLADQLAWERVADQCGTTPYDRDVYEQACTLLGVTPLPDDEIVRYAADAALGPLGCSLAEHRVRVLRGLALGAGPRLRRCDECGRIITGSGLVASCGLACTPECLDAMADRPGRYATRQQRR